MLKIDKYLNKASGDLPVCNCFTSPMRNIKTAYYLFL